MTPGTVVRTVAAYKLTTFKVDEVLYDDSDRQWRAAIPKDTTRWDELLIVRTTLGAIAVRAASRSRWEGELDRESWAICKDEAEARSLLGFAAEGQEVDETIYISERLAQRALRELGWWDKIATEV